MTQRQSFQIFCFNLLALLLFSSVVARGQLLTETILPRAGSQRNASAGDSVATGSHFHVVGKPDSDFAPLGSSIFLNRGAVDVYDVASGEFLFHLNNLEINGANDEFGMSVETEGELIMVGSRLMERVFIYNGNTSMPDVPIGCIENPNATVSTGFGRQICMNGNTLAVSAPIENEGTATVYLFDLSAGVPQAPFQTLSIPATDTGSRFSLDVSESKLVVGTPGYDSKSDDNSGAVWIFDLDSANPSENPVVFENPRPEGEGLFGCTVDVEGELVVVGSPADNSFGTNVGLAYVYDCEAISPEIPLHELKYFPVQDGPFLIGYGSTVAICGQYVFVSDVSPPPEMPEWNGGVLQVYDLQSENPEFPCKTIADPAGTPGDRFGESIDFFGSTCIVGTPGDNSTAVNSGAAYVFDFDDLENVEQLAFLNRPTAAVQQFFGSSLEFDGRFIAARRSDFQFEGFVDVFDRSSPCGLEFPVFTFEDPFSTDGIFSLRALDGGKLATRVGASNNSPTRIFVYDLLTETPTVPFATLQAPSGFSGGSFQSTDIDDDTLVVGNSQVGAHVYDLGGSDPETPIYNFLPPSENNIRFGEYVQVHGNYVVISDPDEETDGTDSGRVYVYDLDSVDPTKLKYVLKDPNPQTNSNFGQRTAIHGDLVLVGSPRAKTSAMNDGKILLFDLASETPEVPVLEFLNPYTKDVILPALNSFGFGMAIEDDLMVAGVEGQLASFEIINQFAVYDLAGAQPNVPVNNISSPNGFFTSNFANDLQISNQTIAVSSSRDSTLNYFAGAVYLYESGLPVLVGDTNGDGVVDLLDIGTFIALLQSQLYFEVADTNFDGELNLLDVEPFVRLIVGCVEQ